MQKNVFGHLGPQGKNNTFVGKKAVNNNSQSNENDKRKSHLSASVFATCIIKHLKENCLAHKKSIILFFNGCCCQNRNVVLSNALLHFSIEQKYLEKGRV